MSLAARVDQIAGALSYGNTLDTLRAVLFDADPTVLFDGDKTDLIMPMNQTTRRTIAIEQAFPLPTTIVGLFPRLESR